MLSARDLEYIKNRIDPTFADMVLDGIEATKPEFFRRLNFILNDLLVEKEIQENSKVPMEILPYILNIQDNIKYLKEYFNKQ